MLADTLNYLRNPNFALVTVTTACNCRCLACDAWREPKDIDAQRFVSGLQRLKDAGFGLVEFTGGEPTLFKDLPYLVSSARALGLFVQVMTNGTTMTPELAASLAKAGTNLVNVSVDHYDDSIASEYRSFRNINSRLERTVSLLKQHGLFVSSTTLITRQNCEDIEKVIEYVNDSLGITFAFCPPASADFLAFGKTGLDKVDVSREKLVEIYERILRAKRSGARIFNTTAYIRDSIRWLKGRKVRYLCKAGKNILYVNTELDVFPCFRKQKICSLEEFSSAVLKDLKCNECNLECFREPTIYYSLRGKLEYMADLRALFDYARSARVI